MGAKKAHGDKNLPGLLLDYSALTQQARSRLSLRWKRRLSLRWKRRLSLRWKRRHACPPAPLVHFQSRSLQDFQRDGFHRGFSLRQQRLLPLLTLLHVLLRQLVARWMNRWRKKEGTSRWG